MQKAPLFLKQLSFPCQEQDTSRLWPLGGTLRWRLGWNCCCSSGADGMELRAAETAPKPLAHKAICMAEWTSSPTEDSKLSHPGPGDRPGAPSLPPRCTPVLSTCRTALLRDRAQVWALRSASPLCCGELPYGLSEIKSLCLGYYSENVPSALKPVVTGGLM